MKKRKLFLKILCFLIVLVCVFSCADRILIVKYADGVYSMQHFYDIEKDKVDVLFLGSSHAFETYNTSVLWANYGIASYVLGGSVQPMWNTYYFLKEALKTQSPQLIVLEAFGCTFRQQSNDYARQIKNCYGMKFSANKIRAMLASSSYDSLEFFFPLTNYATRYNELTKEDFLRYLGEVRYEHWMGFASNYGRKVFKTPDFTAVKKSAKLEEKTEKYYRKILELAKERNIPLVVAVTPYPTITENHVKLYNSAKQIAAEYHVPFVNYALDPAASGLDFSVHAADDGHLNHEGNRIFSGVFGEYVVSHFSVSDRRGDSGYDAWAKCSEVIRQLDANNRLKSETDPAAILKDIRSDSYRLFVLVGSSAKDTGYLSEALGTDALKPKEAYYFDGNSLERIATKPEITYKDIYVKFNGDIVRADRGRLSVRYSAEKNAVGIAVYDTVTRDVCDFFVLSGNGTEITVRR